MVTMEKSEILAYLLLIPSRYSVICHHSKVNSQHVFSVRNVSNVQMENGMELRLETVTCLARNANRGFVEIVHDKVSLLQF